MLVQVKKGSPNSYPVFINNDYNGLGAQAKLFENKKFVVITDDNVGPLYLKEVTEELEKSSAVISYAIKHGEEHKNLQTVQEIYKFLVENKVDRQAVIFALGGGVVGDIAGFAAATYLRGIAYVQLPTSLLACVDSSVGGKVGVDFEGNKNFVGAFYQPKFVYINSSVLKTLPENEFANGMAEVIKHGLIMDKDYLNFLVEKRNEIKDKKPEALQRMIFGSVDVKSHIVTHDELERNMRKFLNFGHTFGHAMDSLSGFKLAHGECVAVGCVIASTLSMMHGELSEKQVENIKWLFKYYGLPVSNYDFTPEEIMHKMYYDKKNQNGKITIVALKGYAKPYFSDDFSEELILSAIEKVCAKPADIQIDSINNKPEESAAESRDN